MRRFVVLLGSLIMSLLPVSARANQFAFIPAPEPQLGAMPAAESGWRLVFSEEFTDPQLDANKWHNELPWGRWNPPELQYYAEDALELRDGILRIRAEQRNIGGRTYTSGVISSHGLFSLQYGYIEIRARIPSGTGLWTAFWLLPESLEGLPEIDIVENLGDAPYKLWLTHHWADGQGNRQSAQRVYLGPDFSQAFHTYALQWEPDELIWYIDGVEQFRSKQGIPAEPMMLIINLAIGGWAGPPNATTPFPAYLDLDYIHIYQHVGN